MPPRPGAHSNPDPPPKPRLLREAAAKLRLHAWEIVRNDDDPRRLEATGDAEFAAEHLRVLPPRGLRPAEFAWALVVQSAMALTRATADAHIELWASAAPPNATAGEREQYILDCARGHVCRQVELIAEHGDQDDTGRVLDSYDALARLAAQHMVATTSEPAPANSGSPEAQPEVTLNKPPGIANPQAMSGKVSRKAVKVAVGEKALRKALKYVFSTAMELRISAFSTRPLQFALGPSERYQARFDAIFSGREARNEDGAARTIILRAVKDIVECQLHVERLREWLPTVNWDQIDNPEIAQTATDALKSELKRKLDGLITTGGRDRFQRYADGAA